MDVVIRPSTAEIRVCGSMGARVLAVAATRTLPPLRRPIFVMDPLLSAMTGTGAARAPN